MLYSILCYESEAAREARSPREDADLMARIAVASERLAAEGKLGPSARLMPTTAAMTVMAGKEPLVFDGPFSETKEQLLGFYIIDCATLEEAIEAACLLAREKPSGAMEIRPVAMFNHAQVSVAT
jgi:hypothetical protein